MNRLDEIKNRLKEFMDIPTTQEIEDIKWLVEQAELMDDLKGLVKQYEDTGYSSMNLQLLKTILVSKDKKF